MRFWDVLRGRSSRIERDTVNRVGEMPNIVEAHNRLRRAQDNFYHAVQGVVEENERLRRQVDAEKNTRK